MSVIISDGGGSFGRSSHEERGLKYVSVLSRKNRKGRSTHEERGLKSVSVLSRKNRIGRSSHEERGLKCPMPRKNFYLCGRSSHEERGLKSVYKFLSKLYEKSLLSRGAWIEIDVEPLRL